jgi:hypothetical protein
MTTTPTTDSQVREAIISFKTLTADDKLSMICFYCHLRDNGADIQEAYIETLRQQIEP